MTLESAITADYFMLDINGIDTFINEEVLSHEEEDICEEPYQGLPECPDMDDVTDQLNAENPVDTHDQFVGDEVYLPV